MEIRYVTPTDNLFEISEIYEKSWKFAYRNIIPSDYLDSIPCGRWASSINKEGMHSLVVTENNRIIGTASFCKSRWEQCSDCGEIVSIYFLPEYMGKGYGQHLLGVCIEELRKSGYEKIILWVLEENQRARKFYEKNGFVCSDNVLNDNIGGKDLREIMYILNR
ncbi:MAG: GNAT family N-acetyltransferase [Oscillospiraceae bacterium]